VKHSYKTCKDSFVVTKDQTIDTKRSTFNISCKSFHYRPYNESRYPGVGQKLEAGASKKKQGVQPPDPLGKSDTELY